MAEIRLNRGQIRRAVLQRMGWDVSADVHQAPVIEQVNGFIDMAYLETAERCPWVSLLREARINTAIGQRLYNYPSTDTDGLAVSCDAGSLIEVARWDATASRFVPLQRRMVHLSERYDPIFDDADPDNDADYRDEPTAYCPGRQIELYPVPDAVYRLLVRVQTQTTLTADGDTPLVDAEALIRYAVGLVKDYEGDGDEARRWAPVDPRVELRQTLFGQRIAQLAAAQAPHTPLRPGAVEREEMAAIRKQRVREDLWGREPFIPSS